MKKILIGIAVLIVGFIAFIATIAIVPSAYAPLLEFSCVKDGKSTSESCNNRIRALGHLQSKHGDLEAAAKWYEFAANNDDEVAMFHLGWTYYARGEQSLLDLIVLGNAAEAKKITHTTNIREKMLGSAFHWYEKSAIAGFAPAMNNLGLMYSHGLGTERSETLALQWQLDAADLNNPAAYMNLTIAYLTGRGAVRDFEIAQEWAKWSQKGDNMSNLSVPTLERTLVFSQPIPPAKVAEIREIAKNGGVFVFDIKPLTPDPSLKTFREVQEEIQQRR